MLRVKDIMRTDVLTLERHSTYPYAQTLMRHRHVGHLPVVEHGKLIGLVTDRDLKKVAPSPATSLEIREVHYLLDTLWVEDFMVRDVITVTPDMPLHQAAMLMHDHKIGCLPVVERAMLVGIVTLTDLLDALVTLLRQAAEAEVPAAA